MLVKDEVVYCCVVVNDVGLVFIDCEVFVEGIFFMLLVVWIYNNVVIYVMLLMIIFLCYYIGELLGFLDFGVINGW